MIKTNIYNIAITDNNPIVIQGLATLFKETQNYRVSGVCNNGNALRELVNDDKSINTIFIDLKLPKTNIYRLLKDLIVLHSDIRIIVFSGYTLPKLVQDIMELGIHAYISKKSTLPQILDTVERVHNGEHFIGSSVYQKESKNEIEDNNFILDEVDTFVKFAELTVRELDVIILLSRGYTNKEIASKLILSKYTIETHRKNIMKKFKLKTTGQLIYYAAQRGIV